MFELYGFYTLREVRKLTTLSEKTIRRRMRDGLFPLQVKLSTGRVGWRRKAIHRWMAMEEGRPPDNEE